MSATADRHRRPVPSRRSARRRPALAGRARPLVVLGALAAALVVAVDGAGPLAVTRPAESVVLALVAAAAARWLWQDHRLDVAQARRPHAVGSVTRARRHRSPAVVARRAA